MMSMNSKQPHFAMHPSLPEHKYTTLHSSSEAIRRACLQTPQVNDPRKLYLLCHFSCLGCSQATSAVLCVITRGASRYFPPRRALNVFFMYSTAITRRVCDLFESMLTQKPGVCRFCINFYDFPPLKEYSTLLRVAKSTD